MKRKTNTNDDVPPFKAQRLADKKNQAASVIGDWWRLVKLKHLLSNDFYFTYLALSHPSFQEDPEQLKTSAIMLGIRQAPGNVSWCEKNPYAKYMHPYFRFTQLNNAQLKKTILASLITDEQQQLYASLTIIDSHAITPIKDFIKTYCPEIEPFIEIITPAKGNFLICGILQACPVAIKSDFLWLITPAGMLASPWQLFPHIPSTQCPPLMPIYLPAKLPQTKVALLESLPFKSLAQYKNFFPTQHLMEALSKLIPAIPELNPAATQRIALMLALSHCFYKNNYLRYSYYAYAIVHEISLGLMAQQNNTHVMETQFNQFWEDSEEISYAILGLDKKKYDRHTSFVSAIANSGSHAYLIALTLARKMKLSHDALVNSQETINISPKISLQEPYYFEQKKLVTHDFTSDISSANIYVLSSNSMALENAEEKDIDLNDFIEKFCQTKSTIIIVDITLRLEKDLHLNAIARRLIEQGMLSIILFESLQKFGLLHTDQAQSGIVRAVCSKKQFDKKDLDAFKENGKEDFPRHIDSLITSLLCSKCHNIQENIKNQHFKNAHFIRNKLIAHDMILQVKHNADDQAGSSKENEGYFIVSCKLAKLVKLRLDFLSSIKLIENNLSFGNRISSISASRFSVHASDKIDSQILITYLCLIDKSINNHIDKEYKAHPVMLSMILKMTQEQLYGWMDRMVFSFKVISLEEQIALLTLSHFIIFYKALLNNNDKKFSFSLLCMMIPDILKKCDLLRGREIFMQMANQYKKIRLEIFNENQTNKNRKHYLKVNFSLVLNTVVFTEEVNICLIETTNENALFLREASLPQFVSIYFQDNEIDEDQNNETKSSDYDKVNINKNGTYNPYASVLTEEPCQYIHEGTSIPQKKHFEISQENGITASQPEHDGRTIYANKGEYDDDNTRPCFNYDETNYAEAMEIDYAEAMQTDIKEITVESKDASYTPSEPPEYHHENTSQYPEFDQTIEVTTISPDLMYNNIIQLTLKHFIGNHDMPPVFVKLIQTEEKNNPQQFEKQFKAYIVNIKLVEKLYDNIGNYSKLIEKYRPQKTNLQFFSASEDRSPVTIDELETLADLLWEKIKVEVFANTAPNNSA